MHWWQGALSLFDTKRQGGRASGEGPGVVEVEEDLTELACASIRMLLQARRNELLSSWPRLDRKSPELALCSGPSGRLGTSRLF
jgi:hypothetical protein